VVLVIAEFLSHVKAASAIIGPELSGTGLLVVVVAGFPAADVIGAGSGAGFSVVLMALSSATFPSLVEVALVGGDATARAEPSIPLRLDIAVFLDIDRAMVEVVL
jgi:hypothetical protein